MQMVKTKQKQNFPQTNGHFPCILTSFWEAFGTLKSDKDSAEIVFVLTLIELNGIDMLL